MHSPCVHAGVCVCAAGAGVPGSRLRVSGYGAGAGLVVCGVGCVIVSRDRVSPVYCYCWLRVIVCPGRVSGSCVRVVRWSHGLVVIIIV